MSVWKHVSLKIRKNVALRNFCLPPKKFGKFGKFGWIECSTLHINIMILHFYRNTRIAAKRMMLNVWIIAEHLASPRVDTNVNHGITPMFIILTSSQRSKFYHLYKRIYPPVGSYVLWKYRLEPEKNFDHDWVNSNTASKRFYYHMFTYSVSINLTS